MGMKGGYALFIPYPGNMKQLRRDTIKELIAGGNMEAYVICEQNVYYFEGELENELKHPDELAKEYEMCCLRHDEAMMLRCVELKERTGKQGVLISWKNGQMIAAVLPALTQKQARTLSDMAFQLQMLAVQARELPVWLHDGRRLDQWLSYLAEAVMN